MRPSTLGGETAMRKIGKLLEGRDFESMEEANAFLHSVLGDGSFDTIDKLVPDDPKDRALALVEQAQQSDDKEQRLALANEALSINPAGVDAYLIIADHADSIEAAVTILERALQIAEEDLDPELFEAEAGRFWGIMATRPYVRVRHALARMLWFNGQTAEAIAHAEELLRLSEGDNVGMRYDLISWLLADGETTKAGQLLLRFGDEASTHWLLAKALWIYGREGASPRANGALHDVFEQNPHVAEALFKITEDDEAPDHYAFGSLEEAQVALYELGRAFVARKGTIEWILDFAANAPSRSQMEWRRKVGRNDACPCGSGKKYKRCCLR